MSGFKAALLVVSCLVVSFGGGAAATFAFRKKEAPPPSAAKPFELPRVIRAERFEVADKDGKLRAWMGPGKDGAPEIAVADASGQARAAIAVDAKGAASLTLRDTKDQTRAYLQVDGEIAAASLCDSAGKDRVLLTAHAADATITLTDADGNRRVSAETAGGGSITVSGGKDQPSAKMAPRGVTAGAFEVVDGKGRSRARLAGDPAEGPASLVFSDAKGQARTVVQEPSSDPDTGYALALLDANGKPRLRATSDAEGNAAIAISDASVTIARLGAQESGMPALQLFEPETGNVRAWLSVAEGMVALGLYDKDGKIRVRSGIDAESDPYIQFVDLQDRPRLELNSANDGPSSLRFFDADGNARMSLYTRNGAQPNFRMAGDKNQARMWLSTEDSGEVLLNLFDTDGKLRMQQATRADGSPLVRLLDASEQNRLFFDLSTDNMPALVLYDGSARPRASLYVPTTGNAQLRFDDQNGKERIWVGFDTQGAPSVSLYDSEARQRASFFITAENTPGMALSDTAASPRISFLVNTSNLPIGAFYDSNGKRRLEMGTLDDLSGRMNILNADGTVVWNAP